MVSSETQRDKKEKHTYAQIIFKNCIGCGNCLEICDAGAIPEAFIGYIPSSAEIETSLCTGCGECLAACKYNAIVLR